MKGLVPITAVQTADGIFWAQQDQNYIPRLLNYLKVDYREYDWETVPFYDLNEETIKRYDAVAITPMSQKYRKSILELSPEITVIKVGAEDFMRQLAPKGAVLGRTSGYLIVDGPTMSQKGQPKESTQFTNDNLRQLMRDYPNVYWEVTCFEEIKHHLAEGSTGITVALAPAAYPYLKFFNTQFPDIAVMKVAPKELEPLGYRYEQGMIIVGALTLFLMSLSAML